jgi:hypothetical protein
MRGLRTFAAEVTAASEVGEEPEDLQLKKVLPVLYDKITMMHQDLKQSVKLAVREAVQETQAAHDARFAAIVRASDPGGPSQSTAIGPVSDPRPVARHRGLHPTLEPIRYRFDWKVITATDLWTEWSIGLGSGPSIQQLDSTWGAKWKDQNERQFYSRRLPIIKAIRELHASGAATSLQQAASQLEKQRVDDPKQVRKDVEEAGGGGHRVGVGVMALFYFYYFQCILYLLRLWARAGTTGVCNYLLPPTSRHKGAAQGKRTLGLWYTGHDRG